MAQSQVISEKQFQALARKLRSLQENSISASVDVKLETYWSYGDLIVQQNLLEDAGYHNSILRDLASETGITLRTLQRSVAFRKSYTKPPTGAGLSWTHIRLLAALPKSDLHGRYVASVFASPRKVDIDTCFQQGIFINDVLLQKGHARFIG